MLLNKYLSSILFAILITTLTACGGGGGSNNDDMDNDDSVEMNDDPSDTNPDAAADDDDDGDVTIIDTTNDGSNASVAWRIGGNSYTAGGAVDTFENEDFAILSVNASAVFSSEVSITYTLTGSGSYFISGSPGSVGEDSEENELNPKRIGILVQELDPSSSLGVSLYQTLPDSGFIQVTVDSAGKYHFDIPSSSPISLGSLIQGETMNTIDFSMTNIYDFR